MAKMIMMRGLPASGKSTRAKEILRECGNAVRLNRDLLRTMLNFNWFTGHTEEAVVKAERTLAESFLKHRFVVVVDDTNLSDRHRASWSTLARQCDAKFEVVSMETPLDECIERDEARRRRGKRYVGRSVIVNMAREHKMFDNGKRDVICDLDGTLADISHRLHFVKPPMCACWANLGGKPAYVHLEGCSVKDFKKDWDGFFGAIPQDTPRQDVREILDRYAETHNICLVSGRPEDHKAATLEWLEKYFPWYHTLIMRRRGDKRPDTEVKRDILDRYFDKSRVELVIDDRPSVIRMWRENGLRVEDVGNGEEF